MPGRLPLMDGHDAVCLTRVMRQAGHTLDWGCTICAFRCDYSPPCGCGSAECVDLVVGAARACVAAAA